MAYAKYYNEQDNKEIEMFLKNAHQLHDKFSSAKSTLTARKIMFYVVNLLKACSDDIIGPGLLIEEWFKNHFLEDPEQMLLHTITGEIASKMSCNAMNEVDSHTTTLSVLSILQQFTWEAKALLIVASYILTYANNGLNLSVEPPINKVSVKDDELLSFIRSLLKISIGFFGIEKVPLNLMTNEEDPQAVEAMTQLMVVVYSITRVVVVAASSQLIKRSSIGDIEDKYGTSGSTWCSADLDFIEERLNTIINIIIKVTNRDDTYLRKEEDEEEVRYSYLVRRDATVETFDVNVVGDTLLIKGNYVNYKKIRRIELGKEYRKEEIRAVLNKNDGRLHITLPKFKKPADPQSLHIPVTLSTSS